MIRDSAKLLCRIIEEFENTGKRSRGDTDFTPQKRGLSTPIVLAGLTDRKEWPDATLKAFYYGAELNKGFKRQDFIDEAGVGGKDEEKSVMVTISGEGSPVEEFIKTMQSEGKNIPNRIMLTGTLSFVVTNPKCDLLSMFFQSDRQTDRQRRCDFSYFNIIGDFLNPFNGHQDYLLFSLHYILVHYVDERQCSLEINRQDRTQQNSSKNYYCQYVCIQMNS